MSSNLRELVSQRNKNWARTAKTRLLSSAKGDFFYFEGSDQRSGADGFAVAGF